MEEETEKIGLKEDALRQDEWREGVRAIAEGMVKIWPSLLKGQHRIKTESLLLLLHIVGRPTTCKFADFKLFLNNDHNKKQLCQVWLDVWKSERAVSGLEKSGTAIVVVNGKAYQP